MPIRNMFSAGLAAALLALGLAAPAFGQLDTRDVTLPLIADFEDPEYRPMYEALAEDIGGQVTGGQLLVASKRLPGDGSQVHYGLSGDGPRAIFVDITADFEGAGADESFVTGPGLIVRRSDTQESNFYAFTVGPTRALISAWVDGSVAERRIVELPAGVDAAAAPVRLAARENGPGAVSFYINGLLVGSIARDEITGSRIGVGVFGPGRFTFDDLGVNTEGAISPLDLGIADDTLQLHIAEVLYGRWTNADPLDFGDEVSAEGQLVIDFGPDGSIAMEGELTRTVNGTPVAVSVASIGEWSAAPGPDGESLVITNAGVTALKSAAPDILPSEQFDFESEEVMTLIDADTITIGGDLMTRLTD